MTQGYTKSVVINIIINHKYFCSTTNSNDLVSELKQDCSCPFYLHCMLFFHIHVLYYCSSCINQASVTCSFSSFGKASACLSESSGHKPR